MSAEREPIPFDAFISYSSGNKLEADAVCAKLEGAGIRCWIAPRDILPGREWGEAIIDGLDRSRLMILIFSEQANASPQVRREVERAVSKEMPIIPFRIQNTKPTRALEYSLSNTHWFDAFDPPLERHIARLEAIVRQFLSASGGTGRTPLESVAPAPAPAPTTETTAVTGSRASGNAVWIIGTVILLAVVIAVSWPRHKAAQSLPVGVGAVSKPEVAPPLEPGVAGREFVGTWGFVHDGKQSRTNTDGSVSESAVTEDSVTFGYTAAKGLTLTSSRLITKTEKVGGNESGTLTDRDATYPPGIQKSYQRTFAVGKNMKETANQSSFSYQTQFLPERNVLLVTRVGGEESRPKGLPNLVAYAVDRTKTKLVKIRIQSRRLKHPAEPPFGVMDEKEITPDLVDQFIELSGKTHGNNQGSARTDLGIYAVRVSP